MRKRLKPANRNPVWHPREDELLLYLDGELAPGEHAGILAHLNACWACRVKTVNMEAAIAAFMDHRSRELARLPAMTTDNGFEDKLHALARQTRAAHSLRMFVASLHRFILIPGLRIRGITVASVIVALLIVAGWRHYQAAPVSARELLAHATSAEVQQANDPALVFHRSLVLVKRRSGDTKPIEWHRIDVWHGGRTGLTARRLYDVSGRLVAGEWRQRNGNTKIYGKASQPNAERQAESPMALLSRPEELWRLDLSAASFTELVGADVRAQVRRQGSNYVVSVHPAPATGPLLEAVLTLRRDDLRATGIDLRIADAAAPGDSGDSRQAASSEYSLVEEGYEQEPAETVAAQVFQPDSELLGASPQDTPAATAELAVETTWLLDQIGATMGGEITVVLGADRKLHVQGIVENDARRSQVLTALAPVRSNPAVQIDILSYSQSLRQARASSHTTAAALPGAASASPVVAAQAELSAYLIAQFPSSTAVELRDRVRQFSVDAATNSSNAARHAWVLKRIAGMVAPGDGDNLTGVARQRYLAMLGGHAQQVARSTRMLRLQLEPVFFAGQPPEEQPPPPLPGMGPAIDDLLDQALRNDRAVQAAFGITVSAESPDSIRSEEFDRSLRQTEAIACWIAEKAGSDGCGTAPGDATTSP